MAEDKSVPDLLAEWGENSLSDEEAIESLSEEEESVDDEPVEPEYDERDAELDDLRSQLEQKTQAEQLQRDQRLLDSAVSQLKDQGVSLDKQSLEDILLVRFHKDADFREAVEGIEGSPLAFQSYLEQIGESLPRVDTGGLKAAVKAARDINVSTDSSRFDGIKWGTLTDQEFNAAAEEVFQAAEAGEFKTEPGYRGIKVA